MFYGAGVGCLNEIFFFIFLFFIFSLIFAPTIQQVIANGQLLPALNFGTKYPEFFLHAIVLGLTSATGQWFIFTTIRVHGPLTFATIMVVRQCLNVILSTIVFGHVYNVWMAAGFCIVFAALGANVVKKCTRK